MDQSGFQTNALPEGPLPVTEQAKAILVHLHGEDHLDVASAYNRIADTFRYDLQFVDALTWQKQAAESGVVNPDHRETPPEMV